MREIGAATVYVTHKLSSFSSSNGGTNKMTIGESKQGQMVVNAVKAGHLPNGVDIGKSRLSENAMRAMTEQHKVEFAQVYYPGPGKNGGGGNYNLFYGTLDRLVFPKGGFLINHTHPGGTAKPSGLDRMTIIELEQMLGQKSSVIIPIGKPSFRFNKFTPISGN